MLQIVSCEKKFWFQASLYFFLYVQSQIGLRQHFKKAFKYHFCFCFHQFAKIVFAESCIDDCWILVRAQNEHYWVKCRFLNKSQPILIETHHVANISVEQSIFIVEAHHKCEKYFSRLPEASQNSWNRREKWPGLMQQSEVSISKSFWGLISGKTCCKVGVSCVQIDDNTSPNHRRK